MLLLQMMGYISVSYTHLDVYKRQELDIITAYAQMAFYTLQNSRTDITSKAIKAEIKMFYEKFGNKEVKRLANIIIKEKKENK